MPSLNMDTDSYAQKGQRHAMPGFFFVFLLVLAAFFFLQSSYFDVRNITVDGNKHLEGEEITSLAGLSSGVNIFRADLKKAEEKISLHPLVKEVELARDFPGTILIKITERAAIGLALGQEGFATISEDGYILAQVKNLGLVNYPIISGVDLGSAGSGQKVPDEKITAALKYLKAMPVNIRAVVSEINVSDLNNIRMFSVDKAEVRFGTVDRIEEKIRLYQEVIGQRYENRIHYIDISFKGSPVIRFIETPIKDEDAY